MNIHMVQTILARDCLSYKLILGLWYYYCISNITLSLYLHPLSMFRDRIDWVEIYKGSAFDSTMWNLIVHKFIFQRAPAGKLGLHMKFQNHKISTFLLNWMVHPWGVWGKEGYGEQKEKTLGRKFVTCKWRNTEFREKIVRWFLLQ